MRIILLILIDLYRGRWAAHNFSRNSLCEDDKHCSRSHRFLQISPNEQGHRQYGTIYYFQLCLLLAEFASRNPNDNTLMAVWHHWVSCYPFFLSWSHLHACMATVQVSWSDCSIFFPERVATWWAPHCNSEGSVSERGWAIGLFKNNLRSY